MTGGSDALVRAEGPVPAIAVSASRDLGRPREGRRDVALLGHLVVDVHVEEALCVGTPFEANDLAAGAQGLAVGHRTDLACLDPARPRREGDLGARPRRPVGPCIRTTSKSLRFAGVAGGLRRSTFAHGPRS